jgi:hypothetical protein
MILYSKNGDFLGIGKDELSFLGYEDLDEFKSIHSDIADLFVNRPGYIFKFKNFSWIDYALHSGAPKKSVIIKLKSGNEVEVPLKIKELFLYSPTEKEDLYYSIEFTNNMSHNNQIQPESNFIQSKPAPQIQPGEQTYTQPETIEQEPFTEPQEEVTFEEDFVQEETKDEDIAVDFNQVREEEKPVLKLKVDNDIFEEKDEDPILKDYEEQPTVEIESENEDDYKPILDVASNYEEDFVEEQDDQPTLKIKSDDEEFKPLPDMTENYEEDFIEEKSIDPSTDILSDYVDESNVEEDIEFDIVQCVDELGLDMSLVGELLTDYMEKIDKSIPIIKESLNEDNEKLAKDKLYKLKGVSDNLHIHQLSNRLEKVIKANDIQSKQDELEKFEKIVEKFRGELI